SVTVPQSALTSVVLPDGNYAVKADVTDQFGNAAQEATRGLGVHEALPTRSEERRVGNEGRNTAEAQHRLAITGTSTGAVGQAVTVTLNGAHDGGTVASDGTWSVTVPQSALTSVVLPDGNYAVKADVTDQFGNAAQEATRGLGVHEALPT